MTTGRINQVTIVRRGWRTTPGGRGRISYGRAARSRDLAATAQRSGQGPLHLTAFRFSPLHSPEPGPLHTPAAERGGRWNLQAPRGDLYPAAQGSTAR